MAFQLLEVYTIGPFYDDSSLIYSELTQKRKLGPLLLIISLINIYIFIEKSDVCISADDNVLLLSKIICYKVMFFSARKTSQSSSQEKKNIRQRSRKYVTTESANYSVILSYTQSQYIPVTLVFH